MVEKLEDKFPGLGGGYQITSPRSQRYNCIAWAAGDASCWWWPIPIDDEEVHWPPGVPRTETLDAFHDAFVTLGYSACADDTLQPGFEKIALFTLPNGFPTHAARQLANGRWTSKLGELEDIEHDPQALAGAAYGAVVLLMKRPLPAAEAASPDAPNLPA